VRAAGTHGSRAVAGAGERIDGEPARGERGEPAGGLGKREQWHGAPYGRRRTPVGAGVPARRRRLARFPRRARRHGEHGLPHERRPRRTVADLQDHERRRPVGAAAQPTGLGVLPRRDRLLGCAAWDRPQRPGARTLRGTHHGRWRRPLAAGERGQHAARPARRGRVRGWRRGGGNPRQPHRLVRHRRHRGPALRLVGRGAELARGEHAARSGGGLAGGVCRCTRGRTPRRGRGGRLHGAYRRRRRRRPRRRRRRELARSGGRGEPARLPFGARRGAAQRGPPPRGRRHQRQRSVARRRRHLATARHPAPQRGELRTHWRRLGGWAWRPHRQLRGGTGLSLHAV
ncbi:MAG: GH74, partial [uncultured Gemmatimonadaceae bacterium]